MWRLDRLPVELAGLGICWVPAVALALTAAVGHLRDLVPDRPVAAVRAAAIGATGIVVAVLDHDHLALAHRGRGPALDFLIDKGVIGSGGVPFGLVSLRLEPSAHRAPRGKGWQGVVTGLYRQG